MTNTFYRVNLWSDIPTIITVDTYIVVHHGTTLTLDQSFDL